MCKDSFIFSEKGSAGALESDRWNLRLGTAQNSVDISCRFTMTAGSYQTKNRRYISKIYLRKEHLPFFPILYAERSIQRSDELA